MSLRQDIAGAEAYITRTSSKGYGGSAGDGTGPSRSEHQ